MEKITETGAALWAVSFDSAKIMAEVRKKLEITYPLLSDEDSKIIDAFGIRNTEKDGTRHAGIAIPMTLIIDKEGIVQAKLAHDSYRRRHEVEEILAELKKLN